MKKRTVIKGKKEQQLNLREAKLIHDSAVGGVLLFDAVEKRRGITLTYRTEGLVPLSDFLRMNEINKHLFAVLLRNVLFSLKEIEKNRFSRRLISWDTQDCYVDPASWHVYLLYVPLQPYEATGSLQSFLLDFASSCVFRTGEDAECARSLLGELNGGVSYTAYMLELFCEKISEELMRSEQQSAERIVCPFCQSQLEPNEAVCPFCGHKICHPKKAVVGIVDNGKGEVSVNRDENGIITVFRNDSKSARVIWLEDCAAEKKVSVSQFPFRIGKMEGVTDFRICNNMVSRKHADIIREQGAYFVVDLDSTNGTYLNGKRIQPGEKTVLTDGARLTFATSEFKVHID